jgi:hypothetical protein
MPHGKWHLSSVAILVALGAYPSVLARLSHAQTSAARSQPARDSASAPTTEKDQVELAVTVYNSNLALVRDVRQIHLGSGVFPLKFEDVAASINPATVHFRSLSDPTRLNVIEQNYEYDLLDPQKLLEKYVGREVTLVHAEKEAGSTKWIDTKALLLADNNGPVWKIGGEIVTGMSGDSYRFPELPGNLYSRPTLVWTLENRGPDTQRVEASYLTSNMNWSADYVLTVARDEQKADLDGWVTLLNNSGVDYRNAKLQLIAGQIHQLAPSRVPVAKAALAEGVANAPPQFEQEAFSEYHLYTLERRTSIQNNESKQISLLAASGVPVEKHLVVEGQTAYFRNRQGMGNPIPEPVKIFYRFKNQPSSGLGMPLPAGTVRVYQADSKGGVEFVGEDRLSHTPKDEQVPIYVGNAFDVVAERKQTDYKKIANDTYELEYQISLRNHKESEITVEVREPVGGDWEVLSSSYKPVKLDSSTLGFEIPVEKSGSATLVYRLRVKW